MKILITGSNGQLGKAINKNKLEIIDNKNIQIINTLRSDLDLGNELSCMDCIENHNPDWVINCGAYTSVDKAEVESEKAYKINSYGPYCQNFKETGGKLIHISTISI